MRIIAICAFLFSSSLYAKRFTSKYTEFELPIGWECILEGSEYVCQSTNKDRKKEAIIILAAKKRGPQDGLSEYQSYLKQKKTYNLPGGKPYVSSPKYTKKMEINSKQWIDSLHLASEVPGFYTRYLATVTEGLGVAVTFSVGKDYYESYKGVFDKVIASLRVFDQEVVTGGDFKIAGEKKDILGGSDVYVGDMASPLDRTRQVGAKSGGGSEDSETLFFILIGLLAGGFIVLKKLKKKK